MTTPTTPFLTGCTYTMRSVCDHGCVWTCTVLSRTKKQVVLKIDGEREPVRRGIKVWNGAETCMPFGTYSMAPMLSAERMVKA